jgi:hypothetical protein
VYAAIVGNGYGQFDPIPQDLGRAPGPEGLGHLRQRLETLRARATSNGQAKTHREWIVRIAMLDIADALGDAEVYWAARLVLATPKPLNGDLYGLFAPVGELLEKNHPLAATRCLRAMVDFSLPKARSKRYPHAPRQLHTCHHLARGIKDWGDLEDLLTYVTRLRRDHGRKHGFWSLVPQEVGPKAPQSEIAQPDLRNTAQVEATPCNPGSGESPGTDGPCALGLVSAAPKWPPPIAIRLV